MRVSLLIMCIPPPSLIHVEISGLKKWIAPAPSVGLNIEPNKARNTFGYCMVGVTLLMLIDNVMTWLPLGMGGRTDRE